MASSGSSEELLPKQSNDGNELITDILSSISGTFRNRSIASVPSPPKPTLHSPSSKSILMEVVTPRGLFSDVKRLNLSNYGADQPSSSEFSVSTATQTDPLSSNLGFPTTESIALHLENPDIHNLESFSVDIDGDGEVGSTQHNFPLVHGSDFVRRRADYESHLAPMPHPSSPLPYQPTLDNSGADWDKRYPHINRSGVVGRRTPESVRNLDDDNVIRWEKLDSITAPKENSWIKADTRVCMVFPVTHDVVIQRRFMYYSSVTGSIFSTGFEGLTHSSLSFDYLFKQSCFWIDVCDPSIKEMKLLSEVSNRGI